MTILLVVDTVLLLAAVVYIVALLRSHADILRRLAALERAGAETPRPAAGGPAAPEGVVAGPPVIPGPISGTTPAGDAAALSFGPGSPATLLAFLSSGCSSCAPLWAGLREAGEMHALADRVVVVTHDPSRESPARVQRLAPAGTEVVMSSAAWEAYAIPASPHFVLTDGRGGVRGRGAARSWSQLLTMIDDARADALTAAAAQTTSDRAARSERMLARAGIEPGHPSLHPGALQAGRAAGPEAGTGRE